ILETARETIVFLHPEERGHDEGAFVRDGEPAAEDLLVLAAGAAPGVPVGELALAHPLRRFGSDESPAVGEIDRELVLVASSGVVLAPAGEARLGVLERD